MAKKKLLSEAVVRRFMGLAGIGADVVSNVISEMTTMYEEEPLADEEAPVEEPMDAAPEEPAMDAEAPLEEPSEEPAMDAEVELSPEDIKDGRDAVEKLLAPLEAQLPAEGGEEVADEVAPEGEAELEPVEAAPEEEDQEVMEALDGINLELNEDELVQEVAKRVAKRLLKAKAAQKQFDEALGRKKK